MADPTTTKASYIQADLHADECQENIPPKLKDEGLNGMENFNSQLEEDNVHIFGARAFSTPAPKNKTIEDQAKSLWTGVQSALTPGLKFLSIRNKSSTLAPFNHRNHPKPTVPFDEDFSMIENECLPEVTLDLTGHSVMQLTMNDSTLPENLPATPQLFGKKTHAQMNARDLQNILPAKVDESLEKSLSTQQIIDNFFPEITLLEVSRDSGLSPVSQMPSITAVASPAGYLECSRAASDQSEQIMTELGKCDMITNEELSDTSVSSVLCSRQSSMEVSLAATQDVSLGRTLENGSSLSETSTQKMEKSQNSDDGTRAINTTHDLCSDCDTFVNNADITSSGIERSIPEVYSEPGEKPDSLDTEMDAEVTNKGSQQSPESETDGQKVERCLNSGTVCTQDFVTCEINPCCDTSAQTEPVSSSDTDKSTPELETGLKENTDISTSSSGEKEATYTLEQNASVDGNSLPKSQLLVGSSLENSLASLGHHNGTFDCTLPSQQNGTITLPDISSNNSLCDTTVPKALNSTTTLKHDCSSEHSSNPQSNGTSTTPEQEAKNLLESVPKETPEELLTTCDTKSTSKESRQSLKSNVSTNGTFTVEQPSVANDPPENVAAAPVNETLDLPAASVSNPKDVTESRDQQRSGNTQTKSSTDKSPSSSGEKDTMYTIGQKASVDGNSLQKSQLLVSSSVKKTPLSLGHRNGTFDCTLPPQQNATITLSDISSNNSLGSTTAPKALNSIATLKQDCSEEHSSKLQSNETTTAPDLEAKKERSPSETFEANPALEPINESVGCECKILSQSVLAVNANLSDLSNSQSSDIIIMKAHSFNLDESLDLGAKILTASTPMPSCKVHNLDFKQEAVPKKLYGESPKELSHTMPSNIVGDRKTFVQPAAKQLSVIKFSSHLLKRIPPAAVTAGLPVKQHRTRRAPVSAEQAKTSASTSYNLRSSVSASKLPVSGLPRPHAGDVPGGLPRAAPALRTRMNWVAAASSTQKPSGAAAANPELKSAQGKRPPSAKGEALPGSKRKKTDALVPPRATEASTSASCAANGPKTLKQPMTSLRSGPAKCSKPDGAANTGAACDAGSRGRGLKPPAANQRANLTKPQSHGCDKCSGLEEKVRVLEERVRLQSEEIQRLKEELDKHQEEYY